MYENWAEEKVLTITPLPPSGSDRLYFRIVGKNKTAIGAFNPDTKENRAFFTFSRHFFKKGLAVPEIYGIADNEEVYLQQDLGDMGLLQFLNEHRKGEVFPDEALPLYKKAVAQLAHFQIKGGEGLDYSVAYPRAEFDKQSMLWDLNYFKYYFLKLAKIPFDEQALENDFHKLADYLLQADCSHFVYRDFQSRNIMVQDNDLYFIDYQGGRKGALQYDLASLLYQAKANIPKSVKETLLEHYLDIATQLTNISRTQFLERYDGYVLIRLIQVLGAYGFRGLYEKKPHFISSIPFAIRQLATFLKEIKLPIPVPELLQALVQLTQSNLFSSPIQNEEHEGLTVTITSFSYRRGIPHDHSGNGGGFAFDCRSIHNPGRYAPYKKLTGRDEPVITFFKEKTNIHEFIQKVISLVEPAVETYIARNFSSLMVNFGCTGGQHRSVYSADKLAAHLKEKYKVNVVLKHTEQEIKGWVN